MALSEDEQKLLEQMEAALAADDPKLADMLRGTGSRKIHRRRAAIAGIGFVIGILALVAGMKFTPILSIVGFLLMLGAAIVGINSWSHVNDEEIEGTANKDNRRGSSTAGNETNDQVKHFMDKLEERWHRRKDEGF